MKWISGLTDFCWLETSFNQKREKQRNLARLNVDRTLSDQFIPKESISNPIEEYSDKDINIFAKQGVNGKFSGSKNNQSDEVDK